MENMNWVKNAREQFAPNQFRRPSNLHVISASLEKKSITYKDTYGLDNFLRVTVISLLTFSRK